MNKKQILAAFRRDIRDTRTPPLVNKDDADRYFLQGINEIARRTRCLVDSTSFSPTIEAGDPIVRIDPKIISIRRVRVASRAKPLIKATVRDMDEMYPGWESSTTPSTPMFAVVDYETDKLFIYPPSAQADSLVMTVTRESMKESYEDNDVPEIPARWHEGIIDWMKFCAYSNDDSDLFDPANANKSLGKFEEEFGQRSSAINERYDFEHYDDVGER